MGTQNQTAAWPATRPANAEATRARDEARLQFRKSTVGFSRSHGASAILLDAAVAALRIGRPQDFARALASVRRQIDEIERVWLLALGEPARAQQVAA